MSGVSQSMLVAMFMPVTTPSTGEAIIVTNVAPMATSFETVAAGATVPTANAQGEVMVSGPAPNYTWETSVPGALGVTTFESRNGDVVLESSDVVTALGFTPYDQDNPANYQTASQVQASIGAAVAQPSDTLPLMDSVAAPGTGTLFSRYDHTHPTDTSRYAAANPAGYQTAAQVQAVLPVVPQPSNSAPNMDGPTAPGTATTFARSDHIHPTDTTRYAATNPAGYQTASQVTALFPPAYTLNPGMDGTGAPGSSTSWARGDHIHPTDITRYAASNPAGYQTASDVQNAISGIGGGAVPSNALPTMNGVAAAGSGTLFSRDDHVHPIDTSRAPIYNPVFQGTVTLAADPVAALQAVTMQYVTNYVTDCGTF